MGLLRAADGTAFVGRIRAPGEKSGEDRRDIGEDGEAGRT
jgi:hypothetical protein